MWLLDKAVLYKRFFLFDFKVFNHCEDGFKSHTWYSFSKTRFNKTLKASTFKVIAYWIQHILRKSCYGVIDKIRNNGVQCRKESSTQSTWNIWDGAKIKGFNLVLPFTFCPSLPLHLWAKTKLVAAELQWQWQPGSSHMSVFLGFRWKNKWGTRSKEVLILIPWFQHDYTREKLTNIQEIFMTDKKLYLLYFPRYILFTLMSINTHNLNVTILVFFLVFF